MTELRQKMIECLQLRGFSERTQESYTRAVRQLAEHYHKSPDLITEEELRQYFLYIINVKHCSRNTTTIALCGIKFFFEQTLNRNWSLFRFPTPGLVQHRIVWRPLPSGGVLFARRATRILDTLGHRSLTVEDIQSEPIQPRVFPSQRGTLLLYCR